MFENVLGLYDHNLESYTKVKKAYEDGEKVVGIVHATGTGKTLNALQLALDNKDKNILFLTPYNSIIEHIKEIIDDNPNLDLDRDFSHVKFMNYSSLVNMSEEELKQLNIDMLILDEFHHIGAPVWGDRVDTILETHPELLVFGMTAYTVRDRGSAYERDLAEPNSFELFSDKIVSRYDLIDAMLDGVLPVPIYKGNNIELLDLADKLEKMADTKVKSNVEFEGILKILRDIKKKIHSSQDANDLLRKNIKPDGKYIYFCPTVSQKGINDVDTIMKETKEFFLNNGYREEDICFYKSTSEDMIDGKFNRNCFYNDKDLFENDASGKLRIMFAINQYNEGVHAPNVDGVILGRETKSDIVFFEQIGRALSVRGDTYKKIREYRKCSQEEIVKLCRDRNILIDDAMSKDDMIEKLVAPVIIDLVGNFSFIKDLITDLKHRIREYKNSDVIDSRKLNITEHSFDVELLDQDLCDALLKINELFIPKSWEEVYLLAVNYYNKYKDLNVNRNFKTDDGVIYSQYGYALGEWIATQRKLYNKNELDVEKIDRLNKIGMTWSLRKSWNDSYLLAKKYYISNGNLRIPYNFKTVDGVKNDEHGYSLGLWIVEQRRKYKYNLLGKNEIRMLLEIGMEWSILKTWEEAYQYVVDYYKLFGNINIKKSYCAVDGYAVGKWLYSQKIKYSENKLSNEKIELLEKLGINWDLNRISRTNKALTWDENYELARNYFSKYGDLNVKRSFKTIDGITESKDGYNLGMWISRQRVQFKSGKLSQERIDKLNLLNISWNETVVVKSWDEAYLFAKKFYETNGHLYIKTDFKTNDGINEDPDGYNLGAWIYLQRKNYANGKLSEEKVLKLDAIGMIWDINKNYADIKRILRENNINPRKFSKQVKNLSIMEFEAKLNYLNAHNILIVDNGKLHDIFNMSDMNMEIKYGINRETLIRKYYIVKRR